MRDKINDWFIEYIGPLVGICIYSFVMLMWGTLLGLVFLFTVLEGFLHTEITLDYGRKLLENFNSKLEGEE